MEIKKKPEDYLKVEIPTDIPYRYSTGPYVGKFFIELRDNGKIYSVKCPSCEFVFTPPRVVCPRCHIRLQQWPNWQESGPKGTILTFSVVKAPFHDPLTGRLRKVPYAAAGIKLDNGGVLEHFLDEKDEAKIKIGMRVEAVLKPRDQRRGNIQDILFFRIISS
jgi:uncharacterized OB-fold protein